MVYCCRSSFLPPLETSHHSNESFQELFWIMSKLAVILESTPGTLKTRDSCVSRCMFSHVLMFLLTACDLCSVGGQRGTNRFIMATHMKEGLPQQGWKQIWMNRTKVPLPLLEAANSLCCALWSGVMWTTKLCWETDQHKQPRPVCFTLHRHHFLLESICGHTGIKIITGGVKKIKAMENIIHSWGLWKGRSCV